MSWSWMRLYLENGVDLYTAAAEVIPLMSCLWNCSFSNFCLLLQEVIGHQDTTGAFPQLVSNQQYFHLTLEVGGGSVISNSL